MTKEEGDLIYVDNGEIEEISDDVDEILEDTEQIEEIAEDTDEILKRIDHNVSSQQEILTRQSHMLEAIKSTKTAVWILILVWIIQFMIDKVVMWIMLGYR